MEAQIFFTKFFTASERRILGGAKGESLETKWPILKFWYTSSMKDCVFCKIVNRQTPAKIVFEDNFVLALVSKEGVSRGHTLLIPKLHFENIFNVDKKLFVHFAKVMKGLSKKLARENNATGINILNASGKDAQQSVFHLHFHLVPRYHSDGLDLGIEQKLINTKA